MDFVFFGKLNNERLPFRNRTGRPGAKAVMGYSRVKNRCALKDVNCPHLFDSIKLSILVDTKRASIFRAFLCRLLQGMVEVLPPEEQDRLLLNSLLFWHTGVLSYWYP